MTTKEAWHIYKVLGDYSALFGDKIEKGCLGWEKQAARLEKAQKIILKEYHKDKVVKKVKK